MLTHPARGQDAAGVPADGAWGLLVPVPGHDLSIWAAACRRTISLVGHELKGKTARNGRRGKRQALLCLSKLVPFFSAKAPPSLAASSSFAQSAGRRRTTSC